MDSHSDHASGRLECGKDLHLLCGQSQWICAAGGSGLASAARAEDRWRFVVGEECDVPAGYYRVGRSSALLVRPTTIIPSNGTGSITHHRPHLHTIRILT